MIATKQPFAAYGSLGLFGNMKVAQQGVHGWDRSIFAHSIDVVPAKLTVD
jgi:hypothetical protein